MSGTHSDSRNGNMKRLGHHADHRPVHAARANRSCRRCRGTGCTSAATGRSPAASPDRRRACRPPRGIRGRGSAARPAPRKRRTVSCPAVKRSGLPSSVDRFTGLTPHAPSYSNDVCRCCQTAKSCALSGRRGCCCDGIGLDERDDPVGVLEWQPLEHAAVDDAEHGRAQADAEAERERWRRARASGT